MRSVIFLLVCFCTGLMSCSHFFKRHPKSGYYGLDTGPTNFDVYREKRVNDRKQALIELGLDKRSHLTESEAIRLETRLRLKKLEQSLTTRPDLHQYYQYKPYLKTDRQRIEFLRLHTHGQRAEWVDRNKITKTNKVLSNQELIAIDSHDIELGMSPEAVRESWGEPKSLEVAGNPLYQNFRWTFIKQVPTVDGYKSETRIIYFESAQVVGWETP